MSSQTSFSVLIPAYNCDKTIQRCINSILKQDYFNYKIYVIDDCSTDSTSQILQSYKNDGKIYYLQHRNCNKGSVVGRKQLLKLAEQDYVLFIDNDDQFTEGAFSNYANLINKYKLDIVITDFQVRKLNNNAIFQPSQIDKQIIINNGVFDYSFKIFHHFLLWNKAIKREVVQKIQIPDKVVYGCDDHMFSLQLYLNANSLGIFRTKPNYIHYYGAGQWGRDMQPITMQRFCKGYKQTLLYNFDYIKKNRLGIKYFQMVYERYQASYIKFLAGNNEQLLSIYNKYFDSQFFWTLNNYINEYRQMF